MKTEHLVLEFTSFGVPIDKRFEDEVRSRAYKLAQQRPDFYRVEDGKILWVNTTNAATFDSVYNWVLYGMGNPLVAQLGTCS